MQIIADLQLHSKYSRAVSQKMDLLEIARWADKKGIQLVATGDWTHPMWFREIKTHLKETSPGLFVLKEKPADQKNDVFFLLSTEISSIYSQDGQVRRVHNLIFSPSLAVCEKIIAELQRRGANLISDGRPIVGISSRDLLNMALTIDQNILFIPAHAWTPWFSLYGSKSGFNSIEACFGDLEQYIYAIETGLSSDPIMNWQIDELDNRSIISFSDAHSGPKLGREATVFIANNNHSAPTNQFSYFDIVMAIKQDPQGKLKIGYTIEFFPEEGKYHFSGHRNCGIRYTPAEVKKKGITCPVCRQPLTIGVEDRVMELAHRTLTHDDLIFLKNKVGLTFVYDKVRKRKPFVSLVSLMAILLEIYHNSQTKALAEYERLTTTFAPEFEILLKKPYGEIEKAASPQLAAGVKIVRERKVAVDPGFDGVFGKVKVFPEGQSPVNQKPKNAEQQPSLF